MTHPDGVLPATEDLLVERLRERSRPGARTDEHRVALVVEGGGMRGVVSGGMLLALEQLGLRDCFDLVVGTSAGAIASAFFATGKATQGSVMYYDELNQAPFLDRRRLLKLGPALDLDYLVDEACPRRGLDFDELAEAPLAVFAMVTPTDPTDRRTVYQLNGARGAASDVMKATAALPVLAGPSREIDGRHYVDGGLTEQVPWRTAASLGASHLLVLPSQPVTASTPRPAMSFVERLAVRRVVRARYGTYVAALLEDLPERASMESWALRAMADRLAVGLDRNHEPFTGQVSVVDLPADAVVPQRLEAARPHLIDGMLLGARAVLDAFGLSGFEVEQRIVVNHPVARVAQFRSEALADILRQRDASPD